MVKFTAFDALRLVASSTFEPFDKYDFDAFAGVESDNPMISSSGKYVIIIDGNKVTIVDGEGEEQQFNIG